jgi:hypothetical protein
MGPFYVGDGIYESYIDPIYKDNTGTVSTGDGKSSSGLAIHIVDIFCSPKWFEPGSYVNFTTSVSTWHSADRFRNCTRSWRCHSWGGQICISVDYNEAAMPKDVVRGLLKHVVDYVSIAL